MSVTFNGTNYYYATNLQGDITAILNTSGTAVVQYTYDAWGNILSTTGSLATTLGKYNPLRYRGYVYDTETKLYYCQSRYYDPAIGRFINADVLVSTGQGLLGNNMFAYCGNNPVIYIDSHGTDYRLVGGGFQFEIDQGNGNVGVEIIVYWDVDECSDGGIQVAVYMYGGTSIDVNDVFLASILATITENADLLKPGTEAVWIAMASKLSDSYSIGISAVAIWGDEEFKSTEDYTGSFSSVGCSGGKLRAAYAHAEHCKAVTLGGSVVGFQVIPTISVSKTLYWELFEFHVQ